MPQKKKEKKTNKKSHIKKHLTQKQNIIFQSIPNYSSGQFSGHQNNKNVSFGPSVQAETRTDNLVGDLVGRLIGKIETDGNRQTQEYSKEIQPINNTNQPVNNNNVNIYNSVPGTTTTDKKQMKHHHQIQNQNPKYQMQLIRFHYFLLGLQLNHKAEAVNHYLRYYTDFLTFSFIYIIMKENSNI